jgi:cytochrome P450
MLSALASIQETANLSDDEILSQVQTFIFADHDTTGLALTYALCLLSTHSTVREQFYTELDTELGSSQPTLSTVGNLEVVDQVTQETLRLYPSIHTIPRVTTKDVTVGGYQIPAGTETHLSVWRLGRDDRFWENAKEFHPSRWAETTSQSKGYAYIPFGAGPRQCIGRRFALLEAKVVLATIGQKYRLEPQSNLSVEPQMTTQPADNVPVTVHTR